LLGGTSSSSETAIGWSRRRGLAGPSMTHSGTWVDSGLARSLPLAVPQRAAFFNTQGRYRNGEARLAGWVPRLASLNP
jgi:hypothetical protein